MGLIHGPSLRLLLSTRWATLETLLVSPRLLGGRPIGRRSWKLEGSSVGLFRVRTSCLRVGIFRETIPGAQALNNGPGLEVNFRTIAPWAFIDQFSLLTNATLNLSLSCRACTLSTHAFEGNTIAIELGPWYG